MVKFRSFWVLFLFFAFNQFAFASGGELASCVMNVTNSVAADGSDCQAGLDCDPDVMVCVAPTESACTATAGGGGCTIGQKCVTGPGSNTYQTVGRPGLCTTVAGGTTENNALG